MARILAVATDLSLIKTFVSTLWAIQRAPAALLPVGGGGVKWLGREPDHSPRASADVKMSGAIPLLPPYHMLSCIHRGHFFR
jgi:hypothetical protein